MTSPSKKKNQDIFVIITECYSLRDILIGRRNLVLDEIYEGISYENIQNDTNEIYKRIVNLI